MTKKETRAPAHEQIAARHKFCVSALLTLSFSLANAAPLYTLTDLGVLSSANSYATAVNNNGAVVGYRQTAAGDEAFLWINGTVSALGDLPGGSYSSVAVDINARGQVVGQSGVAGGQHAFVWENGGMVDLGTSNGGLGSAATGINDNGEVVGWSSDGHSFMYDLNTSTKSDLGVVHVSAINNLSTIVGSLRGTFTTPSQSIIIDSGVTTNLQITAKQGYGSEARDVNDLGQVIGLRYVDIGPNNVGPRGYLWESGLEHDLGTLFGSNESIAPSSINNRTEVVGYSYRGSYRAFIWDPSSGIRDLNDLILNADGLILEIASDINDRGQIVGHGRYSDNTRHAFLLTPIPEPDIRLTILTGLGLIGLVLTRRKQNPRVRST